MKTLLKILSSATHEELVPSVIYSNLNEHFIIRRYQEEAFGRFVYYWDEYRKEKPPVHLLYHMATGSGKTLIMAGLIIYLYTKGYRNFIFFVNSSNIIDKTRDNFLKPASSKYLFAETILIGNKRVQIKEVSNFQASGEDDINIIFSTIQGLHSRLNTPRENSITYEDIEDKKIVLISDEAHHINADTKKGKELYTEEIISWEGTVNRILNANHENVLLEFTATADLSVAEIEKKYHDKLLFDYPLKQFRRDGFSKEVNVLQADLPAFQRSLQAVLLSQYRRKLFEKYGMNIKPVILFKSRTIKESQQFFSEFIAGIKKLDAADLEKIGKNNDGVLKKAFDHFALCNITLADLAEELKEEFSEDKLISVNSKEESEEKQLIVNNLEEETNLIRGIFVVDKLNEGWDVLNLFDIVRLYDPKTVQGKKIHRTTMSEAQLIGRGARYCPFQQNLQQPLFSRKFDDETTNEMRVCEELYYHSAYNPQYIHELSMTLQEIGIQPKANESKQASNKQGEGKNPEAGKHISSFFQSGHSRLFKVYLGTGQSESGGLFDIYKTDGSKNASWKEYRMTESGSTIIRKAMNKLGEYKFSNLRKYLPQLGSVSEFISSPAYLGRVRAKVYGLPSRIEKLSAEDKLEISIKVLEQIAKEITSPAKD